MRILNRSLDQRMGLSRLLWLLPVGAALAIPVIQLGDTRLALIVLGASAALAACWPCSAGWPCWPAGGCARHARASWRFGLAGLQRRRGAGIVQVTALGLGLMALLLLMIVRTEMLDQWRASLPPTPRSLPGQYPARPGRGGRATLREAGAAICRSAHGQCQPGLDQRRRPPDDRMAGQVNCPGSTSCRRPTRSSPAEFFGRCHRRGLAGQPCGPSAWAWTWVMS
jgi:putative ABC transport system permease protein